MDRAGWQQLADDRVADAKALLDPGRWGCAYYVAGYAVECALKACIAKLMKSEEFPDKTFAEKCWTHNLAQLLALAGLKADLDAAMQADAQSSSAVNSLGAATCAIGCRVYFGSVTKRSLPSACPSGPLAR